MIDINDNLMFVLLLQQVVILQKMMALLHNQLLEVFYLHRFLTPKILLKLLGINNKDYIKPSFIQSHIYPTIINNGKDRLVEIPNLTIKNIQKKIHGYLLSCDIPEYVNGGVKNKSAKTNAEPHINSKYLVKFDISKFFPNTSREKIYNFFLYDLNNNSDIASILSDFCTSNLDREYKEKSLVQAFIDEKNIRFKKHLCTGSPASSILCFLVNRKMFDDISAVCKKNNFKYSIYYDDITISSENLIPKSVITQIIKIINKNGYELSKTKLKILDPYSYKKVTGYVIKPANSLTVPNKTRYKIKLEHNKFNPNKNSLRGLIFFAKTAVPNSYNNLLQSLPKN